MVVSGVNFDNLGDHDAAVALNGLSMWHRPRNEEVGPTKDYKLDLKYTNNILDGYPFLYRNPRTGRRAIICFCEKVGSTMWKAVILRALDPNYFRLMKQNDFGPHQADKNLRLPHFKEFYSAINDTSVPRFLLVRNPYTRALSGYLDKVASAPLNVSCPYSAGFNRSLGFEEFTTYLRTTYNTRGRVNDHFMPITSKCYHRGGMSFDFNLKVEHMAHWYEPFVRYLSLQSEVSSGWNFSSAWHRSNESCFYSAPGKTCDQMFSSSNSVGYSAASSSPGGGSPVAASEDPVSAALRRGRSTHDQHAEAKLQQYYSPHSATEISKFAHLDFSRFRYPLWDGVNPAAYLRNVSEVTPMYTPLQ